MNTSRKRRRRDADIRSAAAAAVRRSVTIGGGGVSKMSAAAARRRRRTALVQTIAITDSDTASAAPVRLSNRLRVQHDGLLACLLSMLPLVIRRRHSRVCSSPRNVLSGCYILLWRLLVTPTSSPVSSAKWTLKVSSLIILSQLMKGVAQISLSYNFFGWLRCSKFIASLSV